MKDTSYLGMWIRYEAGNCAIVINMKRAFKRCPKRGSMVFHDFELKSNLQQNGHHLNTPFMLITMVQVPPPYLIPSPRYLTKYIVQTSISLILCWYPRIFFCGFNFSLGITKYQSDALSTKPLCPWQRSSTHCKLHTVVRRPQLNCCIFLFGSLRFCAPRLKLGNTMTKKHNTSRL